MLAPAPAPAVAAPITLHVEFGRGLTLRIRAAMSPCNRLRAGVGSSASGLPAVTTARSCGSLQQLVSQGNPNRTCHGASTSGRQNLPGRCLQVSRTALEPDTQHASSRAPVTGHGIDIDALAPLTPRRVMNRRIKGCKALKPLTELIRQDIAGFDSVNTSFALYKLGRLHSDTLHGLAALGREQLNSHRQTYREDVLPAAEALTARLHQVIQDFEPWDTTLSLRAYAALRHYDEATISLLCNRALETSLLLKPIDCANAMVCLAELGFRPQELLKQIVRAMLDNIEECNPVEVANVMWGFARLQCHPGPVFLGAVAHKVSWQAQQFSSQELVTVLWSLVRLNHDVDERILRNTEVVLVGRLQYLAPQELSMAAWSFARLNYKAVDFLDELPQYAIPQLNSFKSEELCFLLSGYGFARHFHRVLLDAVAGTVQYRLDTMRPREVAVVAWAYGVFGHRPAPPEFSRSLAQALKKHMPDFTAQGLAMVAKAMALLQWRSDMLLQQLVELAEERMHEFKPLELSQLLWSLYQLRCTQQSIYQTVIRRCFALLQNPQGPYYWQMLNHKVINSIVAVCERIGFVPFTLIDFAESKGVRVRQPSREALTSFDEGDVSLGQQQQWQRRPQQPKQDPQLRMQHTGGPLPELDGLAMQPGNGVLPLQLVPLPAAGQRQACTAATDGALRYSAIDGLPIANLHQQAPTAVPADATVSSGWNDHPASEVMSAWQPQQQGAAPLRHSPELVPGNGNNGAANSNGTGHFKMGRSNWVAAGEEVLVVGAHEPLGAVLSGLQPQPAVQTRYSQASEPDVSIQPEQMPEQQLARLLGSDLERQMRAATNHDRHGQAPAVPAPSD